MKTAALAPLLALLAGCVSSGPQSQIGKKDDGPRRIAMSRTSDCVFHSSISGFDVIDNRYVVFYAHGRRKAYLAEIVGGCYDVKYQSAVVAVDGDNNGQICGFGRDSVAYRRMGLVDTCRILALEELSEERRLELGVAAPPPRKPRADRDRDEEKERPEEEQRGDSTR